MADLVFAERFRAVFHQSVRSHVVIGTEHYSTEGIHERAVAVTAVAGPKKVLDQRFQFPVPQPLIEECEEMRLFFRADIEKVVVGASLFQQGIVLVVIGRTGVVQDQKPDRLAVAPNN